MMIIMNKRYFNNTILGVNDSVCKERFIYLWMINFHFSYTAGSNVNQFIDTPIIWQLIYVPVYKYI